MMATKNLRTLIAAVFVMVFCGDGFAFAQSSAPAAPSPSPQFSRPAKWKFETPVVGSDQWKKEEAEKARLDRRRDERLNSICSKC
jgi:hypothetical protein